VETYTISNLESLFTVGKVGEAFHEHLLGHVDIKMLFKVLKRGCELFGNVVVEALRGLDGAGGNVTRRSMTWAIWRRSWRGKDGGHEGKRSQGCYRQLHVDG